MARVLTLGGVRGSYPHNGMRRPVDPRMYGAGSPNLVGLGTPGEPSWTSRGMWGPRPLAFPTDNALRPSSSGRGSTDPLGGVLRGATKFGIGALAQGDELFDAPTATAVDEMRGTMLIWGAIGTVGGILGTWHGYKRNNSIGWALWWGLMGSIFPLITVPIAFAQGFGKRKGR